MADAKLPSRRERHLLVVGAAAAAGGTGGLVVCAPRLDPVASVGLVLLAFAGWALVVHVADGAGAAALAIVAVAAAAVFAVAVVVPPRGSGDLWGYAMYGRIATVHHASPYVHFPTEYAHDPFLARMGGSHRHVRAPYGPGLVSYAAIVASVAGRSALATRLLFQAGAAIAVAAIAALLWRRTRSASAVTWVALNPLVIITLVSEGHADGLLALAVLAGVLLAVDRRPVASGFALVAAGLVKLPGLLALPAIAAWAWWRHGRREAARIVAPGVALVAVGYLPLGTSTLDALGDSDQLVSRIVPWTPLRELLAKDHRSLTSAVPTVALVAVGVLAVVLALANLREDDAGLAAGASLAAFALVAAYVLPWYAVWALPVLALHRRSPLARLVAVQGAFLLAAYQLPDHGAITSNGVLVGRFVTDVAPVAFVVIALWIALRASQRGRAPAPTLVPS